MSPDFAPRALQASSGNAISFADETITSQVTELFSHGNYRTPTFSSASASVGSAPGFFDFAVALTIATPKKMIAIADASRQPNGSR